VSAFYSEAIDAFQGKIIPLHNCRTFHTQEKNKTKQNTLPLTFSVFCNSARKISIPVDLF